MGIDLSEAMIRSAEMLWWYDGRIDIGGIMLSSVHVTKFDKVSRIEFFVHHLVLLLFVCTKD